MTQSSEIKAEVRAAMRAIMSDPGLGPRVLSDRSLMAGVVKDFLPDAPREAGILLAAVEHGVPGTLSEHSASGMDPRTAVNITASRFADLTMYTPDACHWIVGEIAFALGLSAPAELDPQVAPAPQAQTQPRVQYQREPETLRQWPPQPQAAQWQPQQYGQPQPYAQPQAQAQHFAGGPGEAAVAPGPYQPLAQDGVSGQRGRGRRALPLVIVGVVVALIAAGVTGALLLSGHAPLAKPVVRISARSALLVGSDVVAAYHDGKFARATISGRLTRTSAGEVAKLMAVQYPFSTSGPAAVVASRTISAGSGRVTFSVTPSVETRYTIGVFASSSAAKPLASSDPQVIYVTPVLTGKWGYSQQGCRALSCSHGTQCTRPECYVNYRILVYVPPSAIRTEDAKQLYYYFGINQSKSGNPSAPTTLFLAPKVKPILTKIIAPNEYEWVLSIQFHVGNEGYNFKYSYCTRDTLSSDGLGLPGHHACGDTSIPVNSRYLG